MTETFKYSNSQWERIKQALSRIGVDADDQTYQDGEPLRDVLTGIGESYFKYNRLKEGNFNFLPRTEQKKVLDDTINKIETLQKNLERVKSRFFGIDFDNTPPGSGGWTTDEWIRFQFQQEADYSKLLDLLEYAKDRLLKSGPSGHGRVVLGYCAVSCTEDFIDAFIDVYQTIGGRSGGREDGPAVAFLQAAAEPFFGANTVSLSGSALRARMRRYLKERIEESAYRRVWKKWDVVKRYTERKRGKRVA